MIRLARTGLLATLAAALAGAAGVSLEVEGGVLPASGIAFVTGVVSLAGVALVVLHLVAAAVMIPTLAGRLRSEQLRATPHERVPA